MADENEPHTRDESPEPDGPEMHLAWYQALALQSVDLTSTEKVVLMVTLTFADWRTGKGREAGGNAFPTIEAVAKKAGRSVSTVRESITGLRSKGWLRTHPMRRRSGAFRTSNLYQFLVPPGVIDEEHPGWEGPVDWSNRSRSAQVIPPEGEEGVP